MELHLADGGHGIVVDDPERQRWLFVFLFLLAFIQKAKASTDLR